jgi:hypothetical protein
MEGRSAMLSRSAVAQKCEQAAEGHDRPFVVEWDATDLASFEAKAARDTVLVRYQGCDLKVLYGCSDPAAPGRLGAYGTPHFTSGTVQGFDVENEGELYAKLPLGAAELSGRVAAGESLHLEYFVSGVATNSRDAIFRDDVATYPGCEGATHWVWAYNLGAFVLSSAQKSSAEASAGIGSIGGGGKRSSAEKSVGNGGDLKSCTTQDQRACRVPIRLALRPISGGKNPLGNTVQASTAPAPSPGGSAANEGDATGSAADGSPRPRSKNASADEALADAWRKQEAGDGAACVGSATRAMGLDPRLNDDFAFKTMRATCLMRAGKCDDGVRDYRAALAAADFKREKVDRQLDRETREVANRTCPSATAKNDVDFIERAYVEVRAADKARDGATCKALAQKTYDTSKRMRTAGSPKGDVGEQMDWERAYSASSNVLLRAASCVAKGTKKCAEGLAVYRMQYTAVPTPISGWEKAAEDGWARTVAAEKIDCK